MSSLGRVISRLFGRKLEKSKPRAQKALAKRAYTREPISTGRERQKVQMLQSRGRRSSVPYWRLRRWRRAKRNLYLGYFKTRIGRCHGVIKWNSRLDHNIYIHNLPQAILRGPHRYCFTQIKPNKYKVHFSQLPADLNSAIFYMETLLQEAFENG